LTGSNGFFTIQTPQGIRYTRDGQFTVNNAGTLVTLDGNAVLDTNGQQITIQPTLGKPVIGTDGTITQPGTLTNSAASITTAQIAVTQFTNLIDLRPEGNNNFVNTGNAQPAPATNVGMQQGFLEQSNFNVVRSMVDLITAERWFDSNERAIKAQDDATNQAISNVAKPVTS
jgi:flagellar basal-body rod protein FlgF